MTDTIEVSASEREVIRVFAIDLPPEEVAGFASRDADGRWPLKDALGADTLDPGRVEVFPVSDLAGMGLAGYLKEGLGVAEADIARHRTGLDATTGHVAVLTSAAFSGTAQMLRPAAPLRHVATFREAAPETPATPLSAATAEGALAAPAAGPEPEPPVRLPRWLVSALALGGLVLAALILYALVWAGP